MAGTYIQQANEQSFKDIIYLSYNATQGTQSGNSGTTLTSPSSWDVTQLDSMYYLDPCGCDSMIITIPDANADNIGRTITFRKPTVAGNLSELTLITESGQNIGPTPVFEFNHPSDFVQLVSTNWEFDGVDYKWRQTYDSRESNYTIIVDKGGKNGYDCVNAAITSIGSKATDNQPWLVCIEPGIYVEDTIVIPPYVSIRGAGTDVVTLCSLNGDDILQLGDECEVDSLKLIGALNTDAAAIRYEESTSTVGGKAFINDLDFGENYIGVAVVNPTYESILFANKLNFDDPHNTCIKTVATESSSSSVGCSLTDITVVTYPGDVTDNVFYIAGPYNQTAIFNSQVKAYPESTIKNGIRIFNGATLEMGGFGFYENVNVTLSGDNLGDGPILNINGITIISPVVQNIRLENPLTTGFIFGAYNEGHYSASNNMTFTHNTITTDQYRMDAELWQSPNQNIYPSIPFSKMVRNTTPVGAVDGGPYLTFSTGLSVEVLSGTGYVEHPDKYIKYVEWDSILIEIPSETTQYVVYNPITDLIDIQAGSPNLRERITLGRIIAGVSEIDYIERSSVNINHHSVGLESMLRYGLGPVYRDGSSLTVNSTALDLNISQGSYYLGSKEYNLGGGFKKTWDSYYGDISGNCTGMKNVSTVDAIYYNDLTTGSLIYLSPNYWVKHSFYALGDTDIEEYFLVYGTSQYVTSAEAINADLPTTPTFFSDAIVPVASLTVMASATDINISDIRPRLGATEILKGVTGGGSGGVTIHTALLGLDQDDHTQYLLSDGTRSMTGGLNMGGNIITNAGNIDDVDVSNHSTRHEPGQVDALSLGSPVAIGTVNSAGITPTFIRSDHVHAHGDQTIGSLHSVVTTVKNGFMSSTDKITHESIYTTVNANSGIWIENQDDITNISEVSGGWNNTQTTVNANSASWDSTYTTVNANSASWDSTYTTVNTNSGIWIENQDDITNISEVSGGWNNTQTTVNANSGIWSGWHGSSTRIKIAPAEFFPYDDKDWKQVIENNGGSVTDDDGKIRECITIPIYIPSGYKAIAYMVYASANIAIEIFENNITNNTNTSRGAGNANTEVNMTDVIANTTNYLSIVSVEANSDIYGAYVTIERA